jgi:hypothetical protein
MRPSPRADSLERSTRQAAKALQFVQSHRPEHGQHDSSPLISPRIRIVDVRLLFLNAKALLDLFKPIRLLADEAKTTNRDMPPAEQPDCLLIRWRSGGVGTLGLGMVFVLA